MLQLEDEDGVEGSGRRISYRVTELALVNGHIHLDFTGLMSSPKLSFAAGVGFRSWFAMSVGLSMVVL